jgi:nucleotide-binding universal stress UspA family protein
VVAESLKNHIQAYVTEVRSHAPLTPDIQPDDLIRVAEYNQFLEQTHLDVLRPDADLSVSVPGQYPILLNHIEVHRYYLGIEWQRDIAWEEAVAHWYDEVYLPEVQVIRDLGILRRFPGRTETDLYLWVSEHRAQLEEMLGGPVHPASAASSLALEQGERYDSLIARLGGRLLDIMVPEKLVSGPPPGQWRSHALTNHDHEQLFADLLVPVNGKEDGWCALEQSFVVAKREGSHLYGLHVTDLAPESDEVLAVRAEFESRCHREGVSSALVVTDGEIADEMCKRAALTDLVVVNLSHPPAAEPLRRLASGFRDMIRRCPSPILSTPRTVSQLQRPLVAFDASPKAQEALFIAAYMAGKWGLPLTVITVGAPDSTTELIQAAARDYLDEHGVQAEYKLAGGPTAAAILQAVADGGHDCIVMGGYGRSAVLELALSSTVNDLLRESEAPVLICR